MIYFSASLQTCYIHTLIMNKYMYLFIKENCVLKEKWRKRKQNRKFTAVKQPFNSDKQTVVNYTSTQLTLRKL